MARCACSQSAPSPSTSAAPRTTPPPRRRCPPPPPSMPAPDDVERLAPVAIVPITEHFEMRPTIGAPLYTGADESTSGGWLGFADGQPLDAPAPAMLADAWGA